MTTFNKRSAANGQASFVPFSIKKMAAASALMAGLALAPAAMADMYFGVNAGPMMFDGASYDDPVNAGVLIGKEWGVVAGDIGVQAEFTTTINEGTYLSFTAPYIHDVSINTQAIYGAFRTAGPIYVIGKLGLLRHEIEVGPYSESDSGLAGGVGIGFSVGVAQLELEYTQVEEDVGYLSLGVRF
jgi:outer membrane immunogenic protein